MRNFVIQLLESGKALCAKNFPLFVDAWNWVNQSLANLRGDYDLTPDEGYISVDDKLGFPVIRLMNVDKLKSGGGGNGYPSCYEIDTEGNEEAEREVGDLYNCYLIMGGQVVGGPGGNINDHENKFICIRINPTTGSSSLEEFDTMQEIFDEQRDYGTLLIPLYRIGQKDGDLCEVLIDFRNIQHADTWGVYS